MDRLEKFQKRIRGHVVFREEIPIACQLGFPQLELKHKSLCVRYLMHKAEKQGEMLCVYPAQFELVFSYPSGRMVRFVNMSYEQVTDVQNPLAAFSSAIEEKIRLANQLLEECSGALLEWEQTKDMKVVERYQEVFQELTVKIGVFSLYRGE